MSVSVQSWQDFWHKAGLLADRLKCDRTPGMESLWIPSLDAQQGLYLFAAALHLELDPVFDEKFSLTITPTLLKVAPECWPAFAEEHRLLGEHAAFMLSAEDGIPEPLLQAVAKRQYVFNSSGSTGQAKTLAKSATGLLREAALLKDLYALKPYSKVVTLVRPFHIYGFLHSVLLPMIAQSSAIYWSTQWGLPTAENGFPADADLTITVPAHWSVLTHLWSDVRTATVVSSGAFFGKERALDLNRYSGRFDRYFEILGSTETGGIGHRRIDHEGFAFTLFEGIHLEERPDGSMLSSPFLYPETSMHSPDRFEQLEDGRVLHLGRADRVFKYGGLRYTLDEVEGTLLKTCASASSAVVAVFEDKPNAPQGGLLRAWIETKSLTPADLIPLRKKYQSFGPRPFPAALHFLAEFPRDAQGKVSLLALKNLSAAENR